MIYCSNCGTKIADGIKFCSNCGAPIQEAPKAANTEAGTQAAPEMPETAPAVPSAQATGTPTAPAAKEPKLIDRFSPFFGLTLIVLIFAGYFSKPAILTIILGAVFFAACIFCLAMKYKLKGFTIVALIMSIILIIVGISSFQVEKTDDNNDELQEAIAQIEAQYPISDENSEGEAGKTDSINSDNAGNDNSESGSAGTSKDDSRPQKAGFSESENGTATVGNFEFSVPDYWETEIEEENHYRAYAETSGKVAMIDITSQYDSSDPVTYDILAEETENGMMSTAIKMEYYPCEEVTIEDFDNGSIKGYIYKTCFEYEGIDCNSTIVYMPSEENNHWVVAFLQQTENTEYLYDEDFAKIMNSARKNPEAAANSQTGEKEDDDNAAGVSPDLKAFLDSYEAFVDEYVDFMNGYYKNPGNVISMLDDYTKIMDKYADFMEKLDKYDSSTMNAADCAYYLKVIARVEKKMLSIIG